MIKNILFEMEGVMLDFSPERILRRIGVPEEHAAALGRAVFDSPERIAMERDGLTLHQAADRIAATLPLELRSWAGIALSDWWKYPLQEVAGMDELARELKEEGYRLFFFANAERRARLYARRIPGAQYFDGLFISAEHALLKPEPAIYDAFLAQFGLTSWECLLIDGSPLNVDGARRVDMEAVLFRADAAALRRELNALGVRIGTGEQ